MEIYTVSLPDVIPVKAVTAKSTYGIGFITAFVGGFCACFGMPNNMYTQKLHKAEELAMAELDKIVKSLGADGVMDVRCQIDGLSFLISGTAYKISGKGKVECETPAAENAIANDTEDPITLAWVKLLAEQDNKGGRCIICGKKHQTLVFAEFEDQFGKGQGELCYECFRKRYK